MWAVTGEEMPGRVGSGNVGYDIRNVSYFRVISNQGAAGPGLNVALPAMAEALSDDSAAGPSSSTEIVAGTLRKVAE